MLQNEWSKTGHSIALEQFVEAKPNAVFEAWTKPDAVKCWFGKRNRRLVEVEIDLRLGGEWRFHFSRSPDRISYFGGQYFDIVPDRLLGFTWAYVAETETGSIETSPESRVTVSLESRAGGTLLKLKHDGISTETAQQEVNAGWTASLELLGKYASGQL